MPGITGLQVYGVPGRRGGPYVRPTPAPNIIKAFVIPGTRTSSWSLESTQTASFILYADRKTAILAEV